MVFFSSLSSSLFTVVLLLLMTILVTSQQSPLNAAEQEAVYKILESINSDVPWRLDYPDDICSAAPHGVVCDYFNEDPTATATSTTTTTTTSTDSAHITELDFGYVSDYSPNPPCSTTATINATLFKTFTHLRKLFFYKCFTGTAVNFPDFSSFSSLEELIFIENPALVGSISGSIGKLTNLRRLVLTGTSVSGNIPDELHCLNNLEQLTLSRNNLNGVVSMTFSNLKKLKVLDLSENKLSGKIPESIGNLSQLVKLDLSFNNFSEKIPENLKYLQTLEFLDLSYNKFGNFGIPLFLSEMGNLKEVYLSGNFLGGVIPEIWKNLGGVIGLGLSKTGLIGKIPKSMGVYLQKASYIGLDNNNLEGTVPKEFETLEFVNELNLENNNLSGKVPFSAKFVLKLKEKLKLKGNSQICVDEVLLRSADKVDANVGGQLKMCAAAEENDMSESDNFLFSDGGCLMPRGIYYLFMFFGFLLFLLFV